MLLPSHENKRLTKLQLDQIRQRQSFDMLLCGSRISYYPTAGKFMVIKLQHFSYFGDAVFCKTK